MSITDMDKWQKELKELGMVEPAPKEEGIKLPELDPFKVLQAFDNYEADDLSGNFTEDLFRRIHAVKEAQRISDQAEIVKQLPALLDKARKEAAKEIFEKLEKLIGGHTALEPNSNHSSCKPSCLMCKIGALKAEFHYSQSI